MLHMFDSPVSRRNLLVGGSALAAAAALPEVKAGAHGGARYDWTDPNDNLEAYVKVANSLKDRDWVHGWYNGIVFGMLPNKTPDALFGLEGFGLGYTVRQENGSFVSYWKEVGFYKDLKTNQVIESHKNPYTGETNEVMHIHNRMVKGFLGPKFFASAPVGDQAGRMDFKFPNYRASDDPTNPFVLNWTELGDQTSVWMDFRGEVPNLLDPKVWVKESSGERMPICEMFEYVADTNEVHDRSRDRVGHSGSWIRLAPWLPWQMMGQSEGRLFYRCTTKKLDSLEMLPDRILAYADKNYSDYLVQEIDEDMPSESSFEVYMKEREPAKI
jgi:hypothetical protein